jgi:hypothetical protein
MSERKNMLWQKKIFSFTASVLLVVGTLLVGISLEVPNASAGAQSLDAGELRLNMLTDFGRIFLPLQWPNSGTFHTVSNSGFGYMGLVVDQQNYDHTPGSTDVADCYTSAVSNYMTTDDFVTVKTAELIIDTPAMDKMIASFQNTGTSQDANDIFINQTAWTVQNKDWAIIQWNVINIKNPAADILDFKIGMEVDISQINGTSYGLGGDSGDDVDGFDVAEDVYWAQDNGGTGECLGFSSVIVSDPINHYYSKDYYPATYDGYKTMWEDEDWLYGRISAPNSVEGTATQGNRTSTVGWNGFTIPASGSRTFTMVIAMNNTYSSMINAIKDAQWYYRNVLTGFQMTEFSDSVGSHQVEVYNNGREPTDTATFDISIDGGSTFLSGTWNPPIIQTYDYSVFTVSGGGSIGEHGDTIGFYENTALMEQVSYGQEGIIPDPTPTMSVGRYFDQSTASYVDDWTHHLVSGDTFGSQNDVGYTVANTWILLNRVMYNPIINLESYVEIMYRGFSQTGLDISNYMVVANDGYTISGPVNLNVTNKFYVFCQSDMAAFFSNLDINGDNIYLYDANGNLLDMVGWNDPHTLGYFMSRSPDGGGTYQGYDDATSIAAGWVFDQQPVVMLTEFYADGASAQIEVYSPRGGEIILDGRWSIQSSSGPLNLAPNSGTIPRNGGYDYFTDSLPNAPGVEGDVFTLLYDPGSGQITMDQIGYGTHGIAPDPLSGESTSRYWDDNIPGYNDDWTRDITTSFGSQNVVPAVNRSSIVILNEVMFNTPDSGKYFVIINRIPGWFINISGFIMVSDQEYVLPDFPITPGGFNGTLWPPGWPQNSVLIKFTDDQPNSDPFFQTMNDNAPIGDNVYFYDPNGRLLDMVGWDTQHTSGMTVRRVPDGNGTHQGYDDVSSEAASWVFDNPLAVQVTEISDDQGSSQIEIYNPIYSLINFDNPSYTFQNSTGAALTGNWIDPDANAGEYALFDLSGPGLSNEGDSIRFYQNGILIEDISYGTKGTVPDPLAGESVQRYWNGLEYTNVWERNWTSGPNFGFQNDVPPANFSSYPILNEVLFYPNAISDHFVEVFHLGINQIDISGYKIVCDTEYVIPDGTFLDFGTRYYYLLYTMNNTFFDEMDISGDNVYLYDSNGSLIDMVGWNSPHTQGKTITRVPTGNGTSDGFDDISSFAASWRFDSTPTVRLIRIDTEIGTSATGYGRFGTWIEFTLWVQNLQSVFDTISIENFTQEGWTVDIFDETGMIKITELVMGANDTTFILVNITLPGQIPFAVMDNITIEIRSSNSEIIGDSIILNPRILPFLNVTKEVSPSQVYLNGTGHDERATLTLNLTGMGAQVAVRRFMDAVFCIDSSGSMTSTDPFELRIVESQNFVANYFSPDDRGAVVEFDTVATLVGGDHLSMDYAQIINNLDLIDASGGTTISSGLDASIDELLNYGVPEHTQVIILITDAQNNDPADDALCRNLAQIAADNSIIIISIGLAMIPNSTPELLLKDIANITGGLYFPAPDASYFKYIYENISAYLTDLAVWVEIMDPNPMIRDVLQDYIDYIPGTFNIVPDSIDPSGKILDWDLDRIKLGETVSITFHIVSNQPGTVETNVFDESRAYYMTWDNSTETVYFPQVWLDVLPPAPYPPRLYDTINVVGNDVKLEWDEPLSPASDYFLIYRATSPMDFDFSTPWVDTSVDIDLGGPLTAVGLRFSWNDTGAADISTPQYYYCIRTVNNVGQTSTTSRTVGKWTVSFPQGVSTFSLPLEPLDIISPTADYFLNDMGARYIKWMNPATNKWLQHGDGFINNVILEVGRGYEVAFDTATDYTFTGMPAAMIRHDLVGFRGFNYDSDAKSLRVTNVNPAGDVTLEWDEPIGMDIFGGYDVYYSTTRDGFDDDSAQLLTSLPAFTRVATHQFAAASEAQYYYMVVAFNETLVEGSSTYSIAVWTEEYNAGYDTMGIPVVLTTNRTADWWCEQINDVVGFNYLFDTTTGEWGWHAQRMPEGAFDPTLVMTEGYQISTKATAKYIFIGR